VAVTGLGLDDVPAGARLELARCARGDHPPASSTARRTGRANSPAADADASGGVGTSHGATATAPEQVVDAFLAAARDGDFDALVAVLDPDIVLREDTGSGSLFEVRGAENVAGRATAVAQLGLVARPARVNGAAGWISYVDGNVYAVGALTFHDGRITTMDILRDPARLARLDLTALDTQP
jgi:RNA polymerase sigma-70 factor (ECF subfamily)